MAKATLPTNFKDDELSSAMDGFRRYKLINNSDGTVSLQDVTDYSAIGSAFGAGNINATDTAANAALDAGKVIQDWNTALATTSAGYAIGALALKQFCNS